MKKYLLYAVVSITCLSQYSCDVLDQAPLDSFTDEAVWGDLALAETYLNTCYTTIRGEGQNSTRFSSFTDEVYQLHTYGTENVRQGLMTPDSYHIGWALSMWNPWDFYYKAIKNVNVFLGEIDNVPLSTSPTDAEWRDQLKGQGHFVRAYLYHRLYGLYGRVPIIAEVHSLDSEFTETRLSLDEVCDFIVSDCDKAIDLLPVKYKNAGDFGRVTKGAAMSLKGRVLLFAASPLYGTPSPDKWRKASDVNKAVIDLVDEGGAQAYSLRTAADSESYSELFFDTTNPEVIFQKMYDTKYQTANENSFFLHQAPCGNGNGFGGWGTMQPTVELVDAFQCADGTPYQIQPENEYPWNNRDPRLRANILLDGDMWGYGSDRRELEFFNGENGGRDGRDAGASPSYWNATKTGYGMRKFLDPDFDDYAGEMNTTPWFILRLAEVYLNYAECQIELGNNGEALKYINMIRERAGMPAAKGTDIRADYEYERLIELMFEGQRWFDLRRWMKTEEVYAKPLMGISIWRDADGNKRYVRNQEPLEVRTFHASRNYWVPVPRYEARRAPQIDLAPYE